jgi:hypothetical protein
LTVDVIHLIEERPFNPPRPVEVAHDGRWWPGVQHAWRLCDDGRGWIADVEFTAVHDWGRGKYVPVVAPDRVRVTD